MTPFLSSLGKRIRTLRKARALSQEVLAERAHIHPTFISQIERGVTAPTVTTLVKISSALGVQPSDLLGGKIPVRPSSEKESMVLEVAWLLRNKSLKTILLARSLVKELVKIMP